MADIASNWNQLTLLKKAILAGVVVATLIAFSALINVSSQPRLAFLYGGLDPAAAGDVLSALEAMDVRADVRGEAIYVPETRRDSIRMALARQGLPQQGQPGFELLDELSGFATTAEMFDAAYWRAKEGELARTILSTPGVKAVRVHLAVPKSSSFSRHKRAPSASATISTRGGRLDLHRATAIRYLIALAVPALEPDQVAIIDSSHGIILKPGAGTPEMEFGGDESDRTRRMERSLIDLLEARVGPGNVRVSVSLKIDRERETISERILDPESRVMMSRDTSDIQQSNVENANAVTVASNLPDGDVDGANSPAQSTRSETNENSRFEISEVRREREKLPGQVAQVHVAVLLNEPGSKNVDGAAEIERRPEEELNAIKELVAASIGFNESRGDVVTVKAFPFHEMEVVEVEEKTSGIADYLQSHLISVLQLLIPALVVLALAIFVLKPIILQKPAEIAQEAALIRSETGASGDIAQIESANSPVDELRNVASENKELTTTVLKSWLGETGQAA